MRKIYLTLLILVIAALMTPVFAAEVPTVKCTDSALSSVTLSWNEVPDAESYTFEWASDSSFKSNRNEKTVTGHTTTIKGLSPGATRYVRVSADGEEWSETLKVSALTYEKRADQILKTMSLNQKAAQMLLVERPSKKALTKVKNNQYGGYYFLSKAFEGKSKKEVRNMIKRYQNASKIKMFMAVDEEGGTVVRVSNHKKLRKSKYLSPRKLYSKGGYTKIRKDTKSKSKLLKSLGLNTNFAPVADMPYRKSDFMYQRAMSTSQKKVSKYIKTVVKEMNNNDMVSCLKHFPGYGGNGDTHTSVIRDKRSLKKLKARDLKPFKAGVDNNCSMIMVSHNIVNCLDSKRPASISKKVHNYLRNDMGYDGVIITDELTMSGVAKYAKTPGKLAVKAVKAGNDMLCTFSASKSKAGIVSAVKSGEISQSRIDKSVKRILILKLKKGLIK